MTVFVFLISLSIFVLPIIGYFCIFNDFSWLWFLILFFATVLMIVFIFATNRSSSMKKHANLIYHLNAGLGSGFGWIWMLSIPANIWFIIDALFLGGAWTQLFYSLSIGIISKILLRSFLDQASWLDSMRS
jgi:hypothetical protein